MCFLQCCLLVASAATTHLGGGRAFGQPGSGQRAGQVHAMLRVPAALLIDAGVVKLADARDSKSRDPKGREGSTPSSGTKITNKYGPILATAPASPISMIPVLA